MSHISRISPNQVIAFCQRWHVIEFSLFGSVLRDDFGPESDIDVLVHFDPQAQWSLFDLGDMREELCELFGRDVDLVERDALRNPYRRQAILREREVLYAA